MKDLMRSLCCLALVCLSSSAGAATRSYFGIEMTDAGDLNGDSHHDLLSVVALGSNELGLYAIDGVTGAEIWFADGFTTQYTAYEFTPVTTIDSIDGDKIRDVVLGVGKERTIFFLSGKDGTAIDKLEGPGDHFGTSLLALTRDLDGDGIDDLLVGSPTQYAAGCSSAPNSSGMVLAVSTSTRTILWQRAAPAGGSNFGWAMTELHKDYDGDFKPDVLVSDNCRLNASSRGAVYVLSSVTGAILQTVNNPTAQPNWKNVMFGYALAATTDLDGDHIPDYFVGAPNIYGEEATTAVDLISGATGELICHYVSPTGDPLDGFGASLAGGRFKLGDPANVCYDGQSPYGKPHDLLVGSPDYPDAFGVGRAYVLRIHAGACTTAPLLTLDGTEQYSWFGNRVGLIQPPWGEPCVDIRGYTDLLINSAVDPTEGGGNSLGSIHRHSGDTGGFKQLYVAP
jgi:hypothetical protein